MNRSICLLGQHELDYPRNRTLKEVLHRLNFKVYECHSRVPFPQRQWQLVRQFWKMRHQFNQIWITEGGHRFVLIFKILSLFTGHTIIFDPFTSRYNTRVEDRKLYAPRSIQALIAWWQDWASCKSADILVFDTLEHRDYFYTKYKLKSPFFVLPVLIPEDKFQVDEELKVENPNFKVLFYGTYIPLQGIETIVEAAKLLPADGIEIELVGQGQTYEEVSSLIQKYQLSHLRQSPPVSESELAQKIQAADICLGIFGDTSKASQVVPNKVVQCAAMAKPIITRDSQSIRHYFTNHESIMTCQAASPQELASIISELHADPELRLSLGTQAQVVFKKHFSMDAAEAILNENIG